MVSHLKAIEDIRQLICTKFSVCTNIGPGPAHSHLSNCHSFKLKVPLPLCNSVRFLCSEHSDFISTGAAWSMSTYKSTNPLMNTSTIKNLVHFFNKGSSKMTLKTWFTAFKWWKLTALLIRWFYVVTVTNQSANSSTNRVSVGLFCLFIQEVIRNQTRIALVHNVLYKKIIPNIKI